MSAVSTILNITSRSKQLNTVTIIPTENILNQDLKEQDIPPLKVSLMIQEQ